MFDDAFKAINGKPWPVDVMNLYPFNVRVLVFRDIGPRAPRFEEIVDIGKGLIEAVVERKPIAYASLAFVFPERWLSVRECQAFMNSLAHNPCAEDGTIKEVSILTNSCVMITDFMSEQIAVMHG